MLYLSFKAKLQLNSIDAGKSLNPRKDVKPQGYVFSYCLPTSDNQSAKLPGAGAPRRRGPLGSAAGSDGSRRLRLPGRLAPPAAARPLHAPLHTGMSRAAPLAPPRNAAPRGLPPFQSAGDAAAAAADGVEGCEPEAGQP